MSVTDLSGDLAHNLPTELSSFIGREQELAQLARMLGATRLLTLVGTGADRASVLTRAA